MGTNFGSINLFAKLDAAIIKQAISWLIKSDDRNCLRAATYFFLDGTGVDEENPKTFTYLCARNGICPDRAAKGVWNQLSTYQKNRVLRLLANAGFRKS